MESLVCFGVAALFCIIAELEKMNKSSGATAEFMGFVFMCLGAYEALTGGG